MKLSFRCQARSQTGFSLIEVLVAISIVSVLLTLGAQPLRNYWFKQSLLGAQDELMSEMEGAQSLVTSESHPLVYGIRFSDAPGYNSEGTWGLIKYDPTNGPAGAATCTQYATGSNDSGVFNAEVRIVNPSFTPTPPATEQAFCRANLKDSSGATLAATNDQFVFFYARGSATGGSVTLTQPGLGSDDDVSIEVHSLTGRAEEV